MTSRNVGHQDSVSHHPVGSQFQMGLQRPYSACRGRPGRAEDKLGASHPRFVPGMHKLASKLHTFRAVIPILKNLESLSVNLTNNGGKSVFGLI